MIRNKSDGQKRLSTPISSEHFLSIFNRREEMLKKPDNIKFQDNDPKTVTEIPNKNCLDTPLLNHLCPSNINIIILVG